MKPIIFALIILLLVLQYRFWFANDGVLQIFHLKKQIAEQEAKNNKLAKRNEQLQGDIVTIKKGGGAIENHARTDLGMVKKGEIFYQIVK